MEEELTKTLDDVIGDDHSNNVYDEMKRIMREKMALFKDSGEKACDHFTTSIVALWRRQLQAHSSGPHTTAEAPKHGGTEDDETIGVGKRQTAEDPGKDVKGKRRKI